MEKRKTLGDKYVEFMGAWMAGSVMGNVVGRIVAFILIAWAFSSIVC